MSSAAGPLHPTHSTLRDLGLIDFERIEGNMIWRIQASTKPAASQGISKALNLMRARGRFSEENEEETPSG
jgi:hypothetical protein